ncbi:unnamed protein product [Owenia fusiformis]|uniref:Shisa N-terminal domain-containing protein n=1 Tax=Owenia fusiformis TaxID=6347 RepID=A0A8S4NN02_OWEFU|nr:unnamed protein product [Owenia fusiformis]
MPRKDNGITKGSKKEYCSGYVDNYGIWNNGFFCPMWKDNPPVEICCGNTTYRYCCPPSTPTPLPDTLPALPFVLGGSIGGVIVLVVIALLVCCCCSCCPLYKRRKERNRADGRHGCERLETNSNGYTLTYTVCPHHSNHPYQGIDPPVYAAEMGDPPPYPGPTEVETSTPGDTEASSSERSSKIEDSDHELDHDVDSSRFQDASLNDILDSATTEALSTNHSFSIGRPAHPQRARDLLSCASRGSCGTGTTIEGFEFGIPGSMSLYSQDESNINDSALVSKTPDKNYATLDSDQPQIQNPSTKQSKSERAMLNKNGISMSNSQPCGIIEQDVNRPTIVLNDINSQSSPDIDLNWNT